MPNIYEPKITFNKIEGGINFYDVECNNKKFKNVKATVEKGCKHCSYSNNCVYRKMINGTRYGIKYNLCLDDCNNIQNISLFFATIVNITYSIIYLLLLKKTNIIPLAIGCLIVYIIEIILTRKFFKKHNIKFYKFLEKMEAESERYDIIKSKIEEVLSKAESIEKIKYREKTLRTLSQIQSLEKISKKCNFSDRSFKLMSENIENLKDLLYISIVNDDYDENLFDKKLPDFYKFLLFCFNMQETDTFKNEYEKTMEDAIKDCWICLNNKKETFYKEFKDSSKIFYD